MTAMQMNAELFRQLSIIAEDETLIIRQGQEDFKNGRGEVVKIEDLWK